MDRDTFFRVGKLLSEGRDVEETGRKRKAGVLVVFLAEKCRFLMIRRVHHEGDPHSGQLSFPGGMMEEEDGGDFVKVGLREAWEEVGLPKERVEVCGVMAPFVTGTGFSIVPVLGMVEGPVSWEREKQEVAEVLEVDWRFFSGEGLGLVHEGYGVRTWKPMPAYWVERGFVWGATARIMSRIVWGKSVVDSA